MYKYVRNNTFPFINRITYNYIQHICILVIFAGLITAGLYNKGIMLATVVLLAIYLIVQPSEEAIITMLFIMSFENVFKISYETSSMFTYLQIIPLIKMFCVERTINVTKRIFAALVTFGLYSIFFLYTGRVSTLRLFLGIALLVGVLRGETFFRINCKKMFIIYSLGIIVSSICALANSEIVRAYVSDLIVRVDTGTVIKRFSGLYQNANYFSMEVSIALAGNLALFLDNEESKKEFFPIGIILLLLGIMSQSKTFIITASIMAIFMVVYKVKDALIDVVITGAIIGILCIIFRSQIKDLIDVYFSRLVVFQNSSTSVSEMTTGRSDIWSVYLGVLANNPRVFILGNGIETEVNGLPAHNYFLEAIYCFGIVGCALYYNLLVSIRRKSVIKRHVFIFFVVLIIRAFAANIVFYNNVYYYFIMLFIIIGKEMPIKKNVMISEGRCKYFH